MNDNKPQTHVKSKYDDQTILNTGSDFSLVSCYRHDRSMGKIGMHTHDFFEINVITEGGGIHYLGNDCFEARVGDVFFIRPGVEHGYYSQNDFIVVTHLLVSTIFCERYKNELNSLSGFGEFYGDGGNGKPVLKLSLGSQDYKQVCYLLDELIKNENSEYDGKEIIKIALALQLLAFFSKTIADLRSQKHSVAHFAQSALFIAVINYVRDHYRENISIETLANIAHMSQSTFLRHFKYTFNCTPSEYVMETRVENSIPLLLQTQKPISEIAALCGFFDDSHFCRSFKKIKKMSPVAFRKQTRNNKPKNE